jgi:tRNA U38,U39,U40 pseudouridine synthase TruA
VRTLTRCDVKRSGAQYTFTIEGDGFLYKMCRGIVGTIVQAGLGKFPPEDVTEMLAKADRRVAGMTAPAHGLVLWKVFYTKHRGSRGKEAPTSNPKSEIRNPKSSQSLLTSTLRSAATEEGAAAKIK